MAPADQADLRSYLGVFWQRKWLFFACLVAVPVLVYFVSSASPKKYQSSATLEVQAETVDLSLFSNQGAAPSTASLSSVARLVTTTSVASIASRALLAQTGAQLSPATLLSMIVVQPDLSSTLPGSSGFIVVQGTDSSATRVQAVTNAFAQAVVKKRKRDAQTYIGSTTARLQLQLSGTPRNRISDRAALAAQIARLRVLNAAQNGTAVIVQPASAGVLVAPKPVRNAALGLVLGILLGLAAIVLAEVLDRRLRQPEEVEELYGASLLAVIPGDAFPGADPSPAATEAFQQLRTNVRYFNLDRRIDSVVVTSAVAGEGKTTVATNLALSATAAGADVILVDADLRHPQVGVRMAVEAGPGLAEVLAGECGLEEALTEMSLPAGDGRLRLLLAGINRPNPSAMLGSSRMREVFAASTELADLVIFDTPPLLVVADPVPLLDQASGTILVARLNHTARDEARRLSQVASATGGTILGVVATDASHKQLSGYGYGYEYRYVQSANGGPAHHRNRSRLAAMLGRGRAKRPAQTLVAQPQPTTTTSAGNGVPDEVVSHEIAVEEYAATPGEHPADPNDRAEPTSESPRDWRDRGWRRLR